MIKKQNRFYIEDEHVKDKKGIMEPVWFDKASDAIKHMNFLNKNIKEVMNMTKITTINNIKENDCKLNAEEYDNKKVSFKDVMGVISSPKIEGRFQEILSTQKIKDTETGKEYDGFVDTELLILINEIDKENKQLHNK